MGAGLGGEQALYKLSEPATIVRVRQVDLPIIKEVLSAAKDKFQKVPPPSPACHFVSNTARRAQWLKKGKCGTMEVDTYSREKREGVWEELEGDRRNNGEEEQEEGREGEREEQRGRE